MSNLKTHRVLQHLSDYKRAKSLAPTNTTLLGFALNVEQLNDKLKYPVRDIKIICDNLSSLGFLKRVTWTEEPNIQRYYATEEGDFAVYDKHFTKTLWYRDNRFLIPLIVSIVAILFQLGLYIYDTPKSEKIEKLEQEVLALKIQLNAMNKYKPK